MAKTRWPLAEAEAVARDLSRAMAAVCARIEIAGSIRRRKPEVGDIEVVCLPKYIDVAPSSAQPDMFRLVASPSDTLPKHSCLDAWVFDAIEQGLFRPRPDARNRTTLGPLNKLLVHVETGIAVDIFTASEDNWGFTLLVRTGPTEFNIRVMRRLLELGLKGHAYGGIEDARGIEHPIRTEEEAFGWLQWAFIAPDKRV